MLIYFLTIIFFLFCSITNEIYILNNKTKNLLTSLCFITLILEFGFRWETGTDWEPYFNHFKSFTGFTSIIISDFEYGYGLFEYLIFLFTNNYTILLVIHSIIFFLLIINSFKKYSPNLYLSLLLFYTSFMGVTGSNRQLLALSICVYSIKFILQKKPLNFIIAVLIASSFHSTALIFLICYFLNSNVKFTSFFILLISSIVIGKTQLPLYFLNKTSTFFSEMLIYKLNFYTESAKDAIIEKSLTFIGLIKRMLFLLLFFYTKKRLSLKFHYYNILFNIYLVGISIYFLFSSSLLIFVNRGSLYFNIMEPILLTMQLYFFNDKRIKIIGLITLFILSIGLFFQSISAYEDLFVPYKGIFINSDYIRNLY